MEIKFDKSIEPGILNIYDFHIKELPGSSDIEKKVELNILSVMD